MSLLLLVLLLAACARREPPTPPVASVEPHAVTRQGIESTDNYFWLRNLDDPRVLTYLKAENEYARVMMKGEGRLESALFRELKSYLPKTDETAPARWNEWSYYSRWPAGKELPVHCRRPVGDPSAEEILLDENRLARGRDFFTLGSRAVSPDQEWLAFSFDTTGGERYELRFKNLANGTLSGERISDTYADHWYSEGIVWANDNRTIFYATLDRVERPYRVYRHTIGYDSAGDELVYEEPDTAFYVYLSRSQDGEFLFVTSASLTTTEVRVLDADDPIGEPEIFAPREEGIQYYLEHHEGDLVIRTNEKAPNYQVVSVPDSIPTATPHLLVPHRSEVKVEALEAFANHLALSVRKDGLPAIEIFDFASDTLRSIAFPEADYSVSIGTNLEFATDTVRLDYSSLVTPPSEVNCAMTTGELHTVKMDPVPGYDPERFRMDRLFAPSHDGTMIPISIVHSEESERDGSAPMVLLGYGAYGASYDTDFSIRYLPLLKRGFTIAIAHIRGGGEYGQSWYDQGKLLNKKNSFSDFLGCAEYLVREGYTATDRLVATGRSAGGLLMGAVTNLRPDLFSVVVAGVPFVDAVNTMSDPTIPLTVTEYTEWGNPALPEYFDYIRSYSPYDNVETKDYPHLLITAGLNDSRVKYWEPAKWAAKLRAHKTDDRLLLLKTEMGAGHAGASGRFAQLREDAVEQSFILKCLKRN